MGSLNSPEATETDALYGILSAALETGPQLLLQVNVVVLVGNFYTYKYTPSCTQSEHLWCTSRAGHIISVKAWRPSAILLISLVVSFLSGAYNGGRAVMLISTKMLGVTSYAIGLFGGTPTQLIIVLSTVVDQLFEYLWRCTTPRLSLWLLPFLCRSIYICCFIVTSDDSGNNNLSRKPYNTCPCW